MSIVGAIEIESERVDARAGRSVYRPNDPTWIFGLPTFVETRTRFNALPTDFARPVLHLRAIPTNRVSLRTKYEQQEPPSLDRLGFQP